MKSTFHFQSFQLTMPPIHFPAEIKFDLSKYSFLPSLENLITLEIQRGKKEWRPLKFVLLFRRSSFIIFHSTRKLIERPTTIFTNAWGYLPCVNSSTNVIWKLNFNPSASHPNILHCFLVVLWKTEE